MCGVRTLQHQSVRAGACSSHVRSWIQILHFSQANEASAFKRATAQGIYRLASICCSKLFCGEQSQCLFFFFFCLFTLVCMCVHVCVFVCMRVCMCVCVNIIKAKLVHFFPCSKIVKFPDDLCSLAYTSFFCCEK